jgi:hypothetical protein
MPFVVEARRAFRGHNLVFRQALLEIRLKFLTRLPIAPTYAYWTV